MSSAESFYLELFCTIYLYLLTPVWLRLVVCFRVEYSFFKVIVCRATLLTSLSSNKQSLHTYRTYTNVYIPHVNHILLYLYTFTHVLILAKFICVCVSLFRTVKYVCKVDMCACHAIKRERCYLNAYISKNTILYPFVENEVILFLVSILREQICNT